MDADACRNNDFGAYAHGMRANALRDDCIVSRALKARQRGCAASGRDQYDDGDDAQGMPDCVGMLSLRTFLLAFLSDGKQLWIVNAGSNSRGNNILFSAKEKRRSEQFFLFSVASRKSGLFLFHVAFFHVRSITCALENTTKTRNGRRLHCPISPYARRRSATVAVRTTETCNGRRSIADCICRSPYVRRQYLPVAVRTPAVGDGRRTVGTTDMFL